MPPDITEEQSVASKDTKPTHTQNSCLGWLLTSVYLLRMCLGLMKAHSIYNKKECNGIVHMGAVPLLLPHLLVTEVVLEFILSKTKLWYL